ncbi:hypothetical protein AURANDRAFT_64126 [Aureococcus anophagefferens]|uniref:WW domain-containing protein n=1 Tax=Aureococcus anophagefferens TaxID=44056 RepID=F0Y919_AURAN|nr:hypothetical protein AURANDRAFT_64126 [Aureococcus anophagefferens]EGB08159.1 hypothetical protein AURANDRAFT_64126 [Aureococcus anophagefferens]|eukprot:XP_009036897.1 hypothetical protein AURANDRAFT_64126 [Aureococcus anophagefferens]
MNGSRSPAHDWRVAASRTQAGLQDDFRPPGPPPPLVSRRHASDGRGGSDRTPRSASGGRAADDLASYAASDAASDIEPVLRRPPRGAERAGPAWTKLTFKGKAPPGPPPPVGERSPASARPEAPRRARAGDEPRAARDGDPRRADDDGGDRRQSPSRSADRRPSPSRRTDRRVSPSRSARERERRRRVAAGETSESETDTDDLSSDDPSTPPRRRGGARRRDASDSASPGDDSASGSPLESSSLASAPSPERRSPARRSPSPGARAPSPSSARRRRRASPMAETADRTAEAMVQSYAELSWLRRSVDDARESASPLRVVAANPAEPLVASPRRAAAAPPPPPRAAVSTPPLFEEAPLAARHDLDQPRAAAPPPERGAAAPPPPAAVFQCDHACGFTGAYDAVADHERTCTFQPGRAPPPPGRAAAAEDPRAAPRARAPPALREDYAPRAPQNVAAPPQPPAATPAAMPRPAAPPDRGDPARAPPRDDRSAAAPYGDRSTAAPYSGAAAPDAAEPRPQPADADALAAVRSLEKRLGRARRDAAREALAAEDDRRRLETTVASLETSHRGVFDELRSLRDELAAERSTSPRAVDAAVGALRSQMDERNAALAERLDALRGALEAAARDAASSPSPRDGDSIVGVLDRNFRELRSEARRSARGAPAAEPAPAPPDGGDDRYRSALRRLGLERLDPLGDAGAPVAPGSPRAPPPPPPGPPPPPRGDARSPNGAKSPSGARSPKPRTSTAAALAALTDEVANLRTFFIAPPPGPPPARNRADSDRGDASPRARAAPPPPERGRAPPRSDGARTGGGRAPPRRGRAADDDDDDDVSVEEARYRATRRRAAERPAAAAAPRDDAPAPREAGDAFHPGRGRGISHFLHDDGIDLDEHAKRKRGSPSPSPAARAEPSPDGAEARPRGRGGAPSPSRPRGSGVFYSVVDGDAPAAPRAADGRDAGRGADDPRRRGRASAAPRRSIDGSTRAVYEAPPDMAGPTLDDFARAGRSPTVGDLAPPPSSRSASRERRGRDGSGGAPPPPPAAPPRETPSPARASGRSGASPGRTARAARDASEPRPPRRLALSPPDAGPRAPPSVVSVASEPRRSTPSRSPGDAASARSRTPESAAESRRTWSERSDDRRGRDRGGWHAESPQSLYTATSDPDLSRSLGRGASEPDTSRRFGPGYEDARDERFGHRDDDDGYGSRRFGRRQRDDHPRRDGSGDDDDAHGGASRRFGRAARAADAAAARVGARADAVADRALAGGAAAVRGPPPGRDVVLGARAAGRASPEEAYARFTARRSPERAATSRDRSVDLKRYARHADSDSDGEHRSVAAAELLNEATASALDMRGAKMGVLGEVLERAEADAAALRRKRQAKLLATEKELASRSARVLGPACGVVGPDGRSATLVALEAAHAAAKADGAGERHTLVALLGDEIRLQEKHERRLAALDDDLDAAKARDDFERCILLEKERKEAVASRRGLLEAIAVASSERSPRRELDVLEEELVNRRTAADLATAAPKPRLKRHEDPEPLAEEVARSNLVKAGPLGVFDEATSAWSSRDVELATDPADATSASLYVYDRDGPPRVVADVVALDAPRKSRDFEIATDDATFHLRAPTTKERDAWLAALDPFLPAERADDAADAPPPDASLAVAAKKMNHARRGTTPEPEPRRFVVWEERHDPASGRAYYFCPETGVSSWEMPAELAKAAAADDDADDGRLKRMLSQAPRRASHVNESLNLTTQFEADAWEERADPATGRSYYFNAQTGESTWSPPANALIRRAA